MSGDLLVPSIHVPLEGAVMDLRYYQDKEIFTCPIKSLLTIGGLAAITLLFVGIIGALYAQQNLIPIKATHACLATGGILFITMSVALAILLIINNKNNTELEETKQALTAIKAQLEKTRAESEQLARESRSNTQKNNQLSIELEETKQALTATQALLKKTHAESEQLALVVENKKIESENKIIELENKWLRESIRFLSTPHPSVEELQQAQKTIDKTKDPQAVTIEFGKYKLIIGRKCLQKLSDKLHAMVSYDVKENLSCKIELKLPPGMDSAVCAAFLGYLQNKNSNVIHEQNILALLALSREHCVPSLEKECSRYINEKLDLSSLPHVLQCALECDADDVAWICMKFIAKQRSYNVSYLLKNDTISESAKKIIKWGMACPDLGIELDWDKKVRCVGLLFDISYKESALKVLKKIQKRFHITALKLDSSSSGEDEKIRQVISSDLNELVFLDSLDTVEIKILGEKINSLPSSWLKRVQRLNMCWSGLTQLDAPELISLRCNDCPFLKTVRVPKAQRVILQGCPVLEKVYVTSQCDVNNSIRTDLIEVINTN